MINWYFSKICNSNPISLKFWRPLTAITIRNSQFAIRNLNWQSQLSYTSQISTPFFRAAILSGQVGMNSCATKPLYPVFRIASMMAG